MYVLWVITFVTFFKKVLHNFNFYHFLKTVIFLIFLFAVCAYRTFIYEGRCYQECPPHTYMLPKNISAVKINNDIQEISIANQDAELQSVEQRRLAQLDETISSELKTKLACVACDKSCLRCYGPLNSQCTTCNPGSQLHKNLPNETYCFVFAERSSGDSEEFAKTEPQNSLRSNIVMFLVIIVPAVVVISCLVGTAITRNFTFPWWRRNGTNYVYDRVTLISDSEERQELVKQAESYDEDIQSADELTLDQKNPIQNVIVNSNKYSS